MRTYDESVFLAAGQKILRKHNQRRRSSRTTLERRFRAHFGTTSSICAILWNQIYDDGSMRGAKPKHLLWALLFCKVYSTEHLNASFTECDEKTFRKWSWKFVEAIAELEDTYIVWDNRLIGDVGNDCLVSVDGIDLEIQEPWPYCKEVSRIWFSHKFNGPGFRYEIGICIKTGHCVWINGPFPCGDKSDYMIFMEGMVHYLEPCERVEADDGYLGASPRYAKCPGSTTAKKDRLDLQSTVRARHETFNKRLNQWGILHNIFRHPLEKHSMVFRCIVVITQIILEHDQPLFHVEYNDE